MSTKIKITYRNKVASYDTLCGVCRTTIGKDEWYLVAKISKGRISKIKNIHDNEGVCKELLEVELGLKERTYLSSFRPDYNT